MKTTKLISILGLVVLFFYPACFAAPQPPTIALNEVGGDPVVIRFPQGSYMYPSCLTMRRTSGVLYSGVSKDGWHYVVKVDSTVTKLLSASNVPSNDSHMGTISQTSAGYKYGSVKDGGSVAAGVAGTLSLGWNPYTDTIMSRRPSYTLDEIIAQSASESLGVINEGEAVAHGSGQVTTAAWASTVTEASAFGYQRTGLAWVERVNVGGTYYQRLFWVHARYNSNDPGRFIRVLEMTDTISGWTSTTNGSRTTLRLFNGVSPDNSAPYDDPSLFLNETSYGVLVAAASDEYIRDIAIHDDTLYILSYSSSTTKTYLSAVKYSLPTDGTSYATVTDIMDLDPDSSNKYLVLEDMVPGIAGWGIAFGADEGDTTMYVGSGPGGNVAKHAYTFNLLIARPKGTVVRIR